MKKRKDWCPYAITYGVWLSFLLLVILTSKTEDGQPYPVITGIAVSFLCALVFSVPVWIILAVFIFLRKRLKIFTETSVDQKKAGNGEDDSVNPDFDEVCGVSRQEVKRPTESLSENRRAEELRQREKALEDQPKLQAMREEVVRNRLEKSERQVAAIKQQRENYRFDRQEKVREMDYSALLMDAIRFASEQVYITKEEMQEEYPGVPPKTKRRLLEDLYKLNAIQPRPNGESWLSILDHQRAQDLIAEIENTKVPKGVSPQAFFRDIDTMEGPEFEHYCAELLQRNGFTEVEVTKASGDFGVDVLAKKDGVSYAIQCKCYKDTVGNHAVQEALSGAQYYHCMVAAVMTNNYFTPAAIETAEKTNVLLWDRDAISKMAE